MTIGRREFITLVGGAAASWPLAARAQQAALPVIGILRIGSASASAVAMAAFRDSLRELGFVEGQNVAIADRFSEAEDDRLTELATELVRGRVAVIVTSGTAATLAVKQATSEIPIVFMTGADPVRLGLADSMNRPGHNATGINGLAIELAGKRLGLLRDLVPGANFVAALVNPTNPSAETQVKGVREAARALGWQVDVEYAGTVPEIKSAFSKIAQLAVGVLYIAGSVFFNSQRSLIVDYARRLGIPTMYGVREFVDLGGLISYGSSDDSIRQAGVYAGRILKGEKPGELPIRQPTKFELVINLKTAKALGLNVSQDMLSIADEVIE